MSSTHLSAPSSTSAPVAPFSFHCVICFDAFNLHDRTPVVLPCGHTYVCAPCSKRLKRCMECRTSLFVTPPPPKGLPEGAASSSHPPSPSLTRYGRGNLATQRRGGGVHTPTLHQRPDPVPLPLPKNLVMITLMEAAEREASAKKRMAMGVMSMLSESQTMDDEEEEDDGYESGDDDEKVRVGIDALSGVFGTYLVREKEGLMVFPTNPNDASEDVEEEKHDYLASEGVSDGHSLTSAKDEGESDKLVSDHVQPKCQSPVSVVPPSPPGITSGLLFPQRDENRDRIEQYRSSLDFQKGSSNGPQELEAPKNMGSFAQGGGEELASCPPSSQPAPSGGGASRVRSDGALSDLHSSNTDTSAYLLHHNRSCDSMANSDPAPAASSPPSAVTKYYDFLSEERKRREAKIAQLRKGRQQGAAQMTFPQLHVVERDDDDDADEGGADDKENSGMTDNGARFATAKLDALPFAERNRAAAASPLLGKNHHEKEQDSSFSSMQMESVVTNEDSGDEDNDHEERRHQQGRTFIPSVQPIPPKKETPTPCRLPFRIKYGRKVQVVDVKDGVAKLARGGGYIVASSAQLVKVGAPQDKACQIEGMLLAAQAKKLDLQHQVDEVHQLEAGLQKELEDALLLKGDDVFDDDHYGTSTPPRTGSMEDGETDGHPSDSSTPLRGVTPMSGGRSSTPSPPGSIRDEVTPMSAMDVSSSPPQTPPLIVGIRRVSNSGPPEAEDGDGRSGTGSIGRGNPSGRHVMFSTRVEYSPIAPRTANTTDHSDLDALRLPMPTSIHPPDINNCRKTRNRGQANGRHVTAQLIRPFEDCNLCIGAGSMVEGEVQYRPTSPPTCAQHQQQQQQQQSPRVIGCSTPDSPLGCTDLLGTSFLYDDDNEDESTVRMLDRAYSESRSSAFRVRERDADAVSAALARSPDFRTGLSGHLGLTSAGAQSHRTSAMAVRGPTRRMSEHRGISSVRNVRRPTSSGPQALATKTW